MTSMPINRSRSLNPSTPPFTFPRSSPTLTSHSSSTTSSSSLINSTSSIAHSDTPKAPGRNRDGKPISLTTAKSFGAGWKSSSTSSFLSTPSDDHSTLLRPAELLPRRTRSPSLPTLLPSHFQTSDEARPAITRHHQDHHHVQPTYHLPTDFTTPEMTNEPLLPPLDFVSSSPPSSDSHHYASMSSGEFDLDDHAFPHIAYHYSTTNNPLLHQRSTPNLLYTATNGRSVRFDVEEGNNDTYQCGLRRRPAFNYGSLLGQPRGRLATSASMPLLPTVGEGRNVFIHRVNDDLTEDGLRQFASSFGEVVSVKIPARVTKPHAFVLFKKPEQAQEFIRHLKLSNIECEYGKEDYQVQNKALEDPNSANLYIAGLPTNITFEELADVLAPGKICSWKPLIDDVGNRRGPIMARLQTRPQADEVIRRLNGKYFPGMSEKLQVRIADSDEQKHFKKQQTTVRDRPSFDAGIAQVRCHASMPADISSHAEDYIDDPITLLHKQNLLASQLNAVNDRLARVNLSNQSPAPIRGTRGTPFPTSPKGFTHPVLLPSTQSPWHHRHTSSTFSAESMVGLGFDMSRSSMDTTPWTPYQSNVSGRYGMARDLHHTKSSPELGMNDERRIGGNRY